MSVAKEGHRATLYRNDTGVLFLDGEDVLNTRSTYANNDWLVTAGAKQQESDSGRWRREDMNSESGASFRLILRMGESKRRYTFEQKDWGSPYACSMEECMLGSR